MVRVCVFGEQGHTNEKNFVGLAATEDFVACGSEDNAVFAYYKDLSNPIVKYSFADDEAQVRTLSLLTGGTNQAY